MLKFIKNLLSENSNTSSMRVMSFLSLLLGAAVAFYGINQDKDMTGLAMLVGVFVGSAFGGKVLQKKYETTSTQETASAEESN